MKAIELFAGDVNDLEARVYARYLGPQAVSLIGTLRGPFCECARTLPAEFTFRPTKEPGVAEALVPDPCVWSPELPHVYHADVEARRGDEVVTEFHGSIGLRRGKNA